MSLVMRKNTKASVLGFDRELRQYLDVSRKFRSRLRGGAILVVDKFTKTRKFLSSLVGECSVETDVLYFDDIKSAKKTISELGPSGVKVVVIDSGMVDLRNGSSLPTWLEKEYPEIPVLVFNCDVKDKTLFMSRLSGRTGLVDANVPLYEFVEQAGLPTVCCQLAMTK